VKQAGTRFIRGSWPPVAKNSVTLRIQLSLNKQIAECRMCQIAGVRCQYHFGIGCQFQRAGLATTMNQCETSQFNIILRGDDNLSFDTESPEGASEFSTRIGEYDAHGVGTHDMTVSDDGRLIVIANGGIETHPDFGRTKLNIDSMEPSLVLLDAATGQLIQKHTMPDRLRQLSTRHVDLGDDGRIWFACQYEGPRNDLPPLVGHFAKGEDVAFVDLPEETTMRLANYVGAIAVNRREGLVGLTSPNGNAAVTLDAKTGRVVSEVSVREAAGVAPAARGIAVSSYDGFFEALRSDVAWDQHIVRITR